MSTRLANSLMKDGLTRLSQNYFNPIWADLDARLDELEKLEVSWNQQVAQLLDLGLARIDQYIRPVVDEVRSIVETASSEAAGLTDHVTQEVIQPKLQVIDSRIKDVDTQLQAAIDLMAMAQQEYDDIIEQLQYDEVLASLRDRTNHTGTQPISSIEGLEHALANLTVPMSSVLGLLDALNNITVPMASVTGLQEELANLSVPMSSVVGLLDALNSIEPVIATADQIRTLNSDAIITPASLANSMNPVDFSGDPLNINLDWSSFIHGRFSTTSSVTTLHNPTNIIVGSVRQLVITGRSTGTTIAFGNLFKNLPPMQATDTKKLYLQLYAESETEIVCSWVLGT